MDRLFVGRIGWMTFYRGAVEGDTAPAGGGAYTKLHQGHEMFNFLPRAGRLHGYIASPGRRLDLKRIDPDTPPEAKSLDGVTVAFFAPDRRPGGSGQRLVGWYRNATAFRVHRPLRPPRAAGWTGGTLWYCAATAADDGVLLPTAARTIEIPRGPGAPGQANVFYAVDHHGRLKTARWLRDVVRFIEGYEGPNLVETPEAEEEDAARGAHEAGLARAQGFQVNPHIRRAVEEHAETCARAWLTAEMPAGTIRQVGRPYDFIWESGTEKIYVEVKGAQGPARQVVLTRNEVSFARQHKDQMILYVLHSIDVTGRGKNVRARGGKALIVQPWAADTERLRPLQFTYDLPAPK